jgi:hypothetical protein
LQRTDIADISAHSFGPAAEVNRGVVVAFGVVVVHGDRDLGEVEALAVGAHLRVLASHMGAAPVVSARGDDEEVDLQVARGILREALLGENNRRIVAAGFTAAFEGSDGLGEETFGRIIGEGRNGQKSGRDRESDQALRHEKIPFGSGE